MLSEEVEGRIQQSSPLTLEHFRRRVSQVHLIQVDDEAYLIDKASVSVWPAYGESSHILAYLLQAARELSVEAPDWENLCSVLSGILDRPSAFPTSFTFLEPYVDDESEATSSLATLPKLAINVANDCNLSCTYCYANEGLYGSAKGLLSPEDASNMTARFIKEYDRIDEIQFMGGEPTMNLPAMLAVAETFSRAIDDGTLSHHPTYRLVTNGLKFSNTFVQFCKKYDVELTISLDGPQEIHDAARSRKNGAGSYALVRRSIEVAAQKQIKFGFEPTFSRLHLQQGMSLSTLCQWFHEEFGISILHAPPMSTNRHIDPSSDIGLSNEEKIHQYCSVTEWGIKNLLERGQVLLHDYTARILVSLSARRGNLSLCPAGTSQLALSTSGNISPCWMFTDEDEYSLGTVWKDGAILDDHAYQRLRRLNELELHAHPLCKACAIQPLCFGCKGADYHESGTTTGKPNCDYMRAMVATCISTVFRYTTDPRNPGGLAATNGTFGEQVWPDMIPSFQATKPTTKPGLVFLDMPTFRRS
ncbi:radical SAM protein [Amycolatopsis sp. NPDC003865]